MNKVEFINSVSLKSGLSKKSSKDAVNAVLEVITETLVKKDTINFIGFGSFSTVVRAERNAKVPGSDKIIKIPTSTVAKFKVGKFLKQSITQA